MHLDGNAFLKCVYQFQIMSCYYSASWYIGVQTYMSAQIARTSSDQSGICTGQPQECSKMSISDLVNINCTLENYNSDIMPGHTKYC